MSTGAQDKPIWRRWWSEGQRGAMSGAEFQSFMEEWVADGEHSGPESSVKLAEYTALNLVRMKRVAKTYRMSDAMAQHLDSGASRGQHWIIITESWCGDAAHATPLIQAWADRGGARAQWVLRDGKNGLIDDFLTRGGRSIPIWVVADAAGNILGQWGPRPQPAKDMVDAYKSAPGPKVAYSEYAASVQLWYARNKGVAFEKEARDLLLGMARN